MSSQAQTVVYQFKVGASLADNKVIGYIPLPAYRELRVKQVRIKVNGVQNTTASAKVELLSTDGTTVIKSVDNRGTAGSITDGYARSDAETTVTNNTASMAKLTVQLDQATIAAVDNDVEVHISYPGAK